MSVLYYGSLILLTCLYLKSVFFYCQHVCMTGVDMSVFIKTVSFYCQHVCMTGVDNTRNTKPSSHLVQTPGWSHPHDSSHLVQTPAHSHPHGSSHLVQTPAHSHPHEAPAQCHCTLETMYICTLLTLLQSMYSKQREGEREGDMYSTQRG